jgi:hypothetical protein
MLHMAETMQAKFGKQVGRSMTGDAGFKTAIYSIADSRRMPSKRYIFLGHKYPLLCAV